LRFADRILALLLALWEPLSLAFFVAPALTTISTRGRATAAFLFARVLIAGLGIAAGIALWRDHPHARGLAAAALILSTAASAVTLTTTLLPSSIVPGDQWLYLAAIVVFNFGWLVYLGRRSA
jgi:hypothetical protein